MALDNWFQDWHSPYFDHYEPIKNLSNTRNVENFKSSGPVNFFPLLFSLSLLKSQENNKKNLKDLSEHHHYYNDDEDDYDGFSLPIKDSLGFDDPFREADDKNEIFEQKHNLKPLEITGPFKTWYRWKFIDFAYPSKLEKAKAIADGELIVENNLPLGIEVYKHRIFLALPKWKRGIPITLAQIPRIPKEESPELIPYPNWGWHSEKNCDLITSVFRMQIDKCGRIWVLDSGKIMITTAEAHQHCPPKLLIFDLETDKLIVKYVFEKSFILQDGLYSNIIVDIRDNNCENAFAYMSDVWRFGIVVYRLFDGKAWRITNHYFYPDPLASEYRLHHLKFNWMDGIFGMALSPDEKNNSHKERFLYFHSMSGYREFYVKTSYLRNQNVYKKEDSFGVLGQSRGDQGHISSSVMDNNGIMFYNLVTQDAIGCWDYRKPYKKENLAIIAKNQKTLVFANDIRLDKDKHQQSMWIITNKLPYYLIEGLDTNKFNFRVMSAYTDDAIRGTICDPKIYKKDTFISAEFNSECP